MFQLIVFDLDGTLIDSRRDIAGAANAVLESAGAARLPDDRIARMVGDGAATLVARAFAAAGRDAPPDALDRFLAVYQDHLLVHTRPYPGIPEALAALGARARLAVLTNKPLRATRAILDGLDLARHFGDLIVGGDGPFPRKPDPAALQHLAATAGADRTSTVLVGDSVVDLRTARAAGIAVCLARYGFGFESLQPDDRLDEKMCIVDSPADLLSL